jgi:hypothetical protein
MGDIGSSYEPILSFLEGCENFLSIGEMGQDRTLKQIFLPAFWLLSVFPFLVGKVAVNPIFH